MLETPNVRDCEIFPVYVVPCGDDGKRKPFHILHCLAQPKCDAELRLSPGKNSRLPPECIVKFAGQKGWFADRRGYALCPDHRPGGAGRPPSDMSPAQRRAAFLAIRDRDIAAAASRLQSRPAKPVGSMAKEAAAVRERTAAALGDKPIPAPANLNDRSPLRRRIMALIAANPHRVWSSRREAAKAWGIGVWNFQDGLTRAIAQGFVVQEPVAGRQVRPFRLRLVDRFDPPAIQPDNPEESAMPLESATVYPPPPPSPVAEAPRQPTREDNGRIRDYLDANFDDGAGRWVGELSDAKAAERLRVPRAWVSALREFFGDDTNEAAEKASAQASTLEQAAAALKDEALGIATRAEALEREVRRFLDGRK